MTDLNVRGTMIKVEQAPSSLTCTLLIAQEALDGYIWANEADNPTACQKIDNNATVTICQIDILTYGSDTNTYHVEIWSDNARAGTQYGSDSEIKACPSAAWYSFTFGTNPEPPGDYFIHFIKDTGNKIGWRTTTNVNAYVDTNYDMHYNGGDQNRDACFRVYTMQ